LSFIKKMPKRKASSDDDFSADHPVDEKKRSRGWIFTNFKLDRSYDTLKAHCTYLVYGVELCPTTQRQHHQGYVHFENLKSFKQVISFLPNMYVSQARGTHEQNRRYCLKLDSETPNTEFVEHGSMPAPGTRTDLLGLLELAKGGSSMADVSLSNPVVWARNYRALAEFKSLHEEKRNWVTEVIYVYGPAETGKSQSGHDRGASALQYDGKFIGGYNGEDVVLFDDVDSKTFQNRQFLLQLLDRYPMQVPIKGGFRNWKPRTIFLTLNFPPEVTFRDIWDKSLERRITKVIHTAPWSEKVSLEEMGGPI